MYLPKYQRQAKHTVESLKSNTYEIRVVSDYQKNYVLKQTSDINLN